ncbi:CNDP dipeptidase [Mycena sanguinolenta]|uniref:CNDP dipeptidase n=1 Tax=Mycena sanguinolenta TaxID=230812 RepID=A0A8H6YGZ7_9AGAR|nr:CNDP dipeptidase [Mycena sanguinolenta]
MAAPKELLDWIDASAPAFIARLGEAVAIPSISSDPAHRPHVLEMSNWLNEQLQAVGVTTKQVDMGTHDMDGQTLQLPPVVLGRIGEDPKKKTVLIYGHFDVQPASQSDGWATDPFVLTEENDGRLVGRGSTDDKGPVLGWVNVLQWHHETQTPLPVNLVFCFEGMEEVDSDGLDKLVAEEKDGWFKGVDCMCISDNYWLNTRTPALTYGLRGLVCFQITVSGPGRDLHSGIFGRMVHEPMTDLIALMSRLVAPDGTILIPGVDDMVSPADAEERAIYDRLDYSIADVNSSAGATCSITLSDDKVEVLMGRMRMPALSLHGIEGAFAESGVKTVIPAKVAGKFSIRCVHVPSLYKTTRIANGHLLFFCWPPLSRDPLAVLTLLTRLIIHSARTALRTRNSLVPPQTPKNVEPLVRCYLENEFAKLGTKSKMEIELMGTGEPWVADYKHWNYTAAIKATEVRFLSTLLPPPSTLVFPMILRDLPLFLHLVRSSFAPALLPAPPRLRLRQRPTRSTPRTPDLMREGGSIPVTLTFAEQLGVNVLLLPMGRGDDGAHSTNEKLDKSNYIQGTKLLGSYLYEVAAVTA